MIEDGRGSRCVFGLIRRLGDYLGPALFSKLDDSVAKARARLVTCWAASRGAVP